MEGFAAGFNGDGGAGRECDCGGGLTAVSRPIPDIRAPGISGGLLAILTHLSSALPL